MKYWKKISGAIALGGAVVLPVPAALAQQALAEATTQESSLERIEVTGSAIRRTDAETPSPVQVVTAQDLQRSGYTDVSDVLRNISANGAGSLSQAYNFAFAGGGSGVALRGLAVGSTLTLIDGHRMAPYPLSDDAQRSFVDISSIPIDAVERIEIVKDGERGREKPLPDSLIHRSRASAGPKRTPRPRLTDNSSRSS